MHVKKYYLLFYSIFFLLLSLSGCESIQNDDSTSPFNSTQNKVETDPSRIDHEFDDLDIKVIQRLEAENSQMLAGVRVYQDNLASEGKGISYLSSVGASITWHNLPSTEAVKIKYTTLRPKGSLSVKVNDKTIGKVPVTSTGVWSGFYRSDIYKISIPEGSSFSLEFSPGDVAINVDFIELIKAAPDQALVLLPAKIFTNTSIFSYPPADGLNKYEPEGDRVLVFIGQDNQGVGGNHNFEKPNQKWYSGYLDSKLPQPAGVTSYIALRDDSKNPNANVPPGKTVAGLHNTTDYGAGPVCLKCYLLNSKLDEKDLIIHLSIFYADDVDHSLRVANGIYDQQIEEIADFIKDFSNVAFMVRPGYEFDSQYQNRGVMALDYKKAFRRVIDIFRKKNLTNVASIFSSAYSHTVLKNWEDFYPGNNYVDWIGFSKFIATVTPPTDYVFNFAKLVDKPVIISEIVYADQKINSVTGEKAWTEFFSPLFDTIDGAANQVKAIAYINTDWSSQRFWQDIDFFDETDSRLQQSEYISDQWRLELSKDKYILNDDNVLDLIRF